MILCSRYCQEKIKIYYLYTIIVTFVTIIIIVSIIFWLSLIGAHDVWQSRQSFVTSHTLHPCGGVRVERTAFSRGWSFSGHVRGEYCHEVTFSAISLCRAFLSKRVWWCLWPHRQQQRVCFVFHFCCCCWFFCLGTPLFVMCSKLLKAFVNHQSNQHQLFHSIENYFNR